MARSRMLMIVLIAAVCVARAGVGAMFGLWMAMAAARAWIVRRLQAAVDVGFMYGCVPETEKVYKDTSNT